MALKYIRLFLIFAFLQLKAYDINKTIVDGNRTIYTRLLKSIDKNSTKNYELESTLLKTLMLKSKKILEDNITTPKDAKDYKELFVNYLNTLEQVDNIKSLKDNNNKKVNTIEKEIKSLDANSTNALALELQDALYHKKVKLYSSEIDYYNKKLAKIEDILTNSIKKISINSAEVEKDIKDSKLKEQKIDAKINSLQIDKEQADLTSNSKKSLEIASQISNLKLKKEELIEDVISYKFLLFANALQLKSKKAFTIEKSILKNLVNLKDLNSFDNSKITLLLHKMESKYLGTLKTLTGSGEEELKSIWYQVWGYINQPLFNINNTPISIFKLAISLLIFIVGFIVGIVYKKKIKNITSDSETFTTSTRTLLANLGYYIIVIIAFFISLNVLGVKLSSFAVVAGALSVGIGFGLQNIVSNFVSGLILMFERSIRIGDYIQLDDNLRGYVSDIRMRSTTINTNQNIDVIVPNQKLIQNNVINWTMSDNIRRFEVPFGVAYGTDVYKVIDCVTKAVLNSNMKSDVINTSKFTTKVIMTGMGDSSVNFELFVWVKGDLLHRPKRTASEFLIIIYNTLYENNIEIPFPQQDLHIRSVDDSVKFSLNIESSNEKN